MAYADKDRQRSAHAAWVAENPQRVRNTYNDWAAANRDKISAKNRRQRVKRITANVSIIVERFLEANPHLRRPVKPRKLIGPAIMDTRYL